MAEWKWDPAAPPPQAAEAVPAREPVEFAPAPEQQEATAPDLPVCDYCGDYIEAGGDGIIVSLASVRQSPKSGRMVLLEDPENVDQKTFELHGYCVSEFFFYEFMGGEGLSCPNCGETIG
jgi:hypothetical protein